MTNFDFTTTRTFLHNFQFKQLFIQELGWSSANNIRPIEIDLDTIQVTATPIAQLAGVVVFEIHSSTDVLPDAKTRARIHTELSKLYHENLLIFIDKGKTQSLWYWVKRENGRSIPRDHLYIIGQPGDLFLSKLSTIVVDISELDENGDINVLNVAQRLQKALDIELVTKKFYSEFADLRVEFVNLIQGIDDNHDKRWYASVILNRLMFIYFLQKKGFINRGDQNYLQTHLESSKKQGEDRYYFDFLRLLFFEGFVKPKEKRSDRAKQVLGEIRYLNGSLFIEHPIEAKWKQIFIPDAAFDNLYRLFGKYSWNLDDTPGGKDDEINPDVLGFIFEKYINQKEFGAYYTRPEITEYLCEKTIFHLVLDAVNTPGVPGVLPARRFDSISELLMNLDAPLCRQLLFDVLPKLSLLDPACGSGAFLVAAMKTLIYIYTGITGKIDYLVDSKLTNWLQGVRKDHTSLSYYIKRQIITNNLFGVDIMEEATEITRVRLFLALVASAQNVEQLEPLPNIDFNILAGNSLVGHLRVDEKEFDKAHYGQGNLFQRSYRELVDEKQRRLSVYRNTVQYMEDLHILRDEIDASRTDANRSLNDLLLNEFSRLKIKYEQATWDEFEEAEGKLKKRSVQIQDIEALHPFHWGYEFDEVMNVRGGFDAIITNPPWQIFKPIAKEFCYEYDPYIERRGTDIKDFEERLTTLLQDPDIRAKYLEYLSQFPHVSAYFRNSKQFENQISIIDGKKAGTDINLYKLFVEQCFNLLRSGGLCGIVVPSGIYSDLGTRQLREVLFTQTEISGLFCFENRREIFEGVHRSFKFVVLTFEKGGRTENFPAAFMQLDPKVLSRFPNQGAMWINVALIRRLSPDSLSIMEFKTELDVQISEKMLRFPFLGDDVNDKWKLHLTRELDMTNDSKLFQASNFPGSLPLYEGKMIWHYQHGLVEPRYWVYPTDARVKFTSPRIKNLRRIIAASNQTIAINERELLFGYSFYRLGFRAVTGATNERALVVSIIPKNVVAGNSLIVSVPIYDEIEQNAWIQKKNYSEAEIIFCASVMASFVCDWFIRQKILTNMNMFYVYQLPVPRLVSGDPFFQPIVDRAAKLICISPEYDDLAKQVGIGSYQNGATQPTERARLKAEIDGLVAHLYGLSELEFEHILHTFPLVANQVKEYAMNAYRLYTPEHEIATFLAIGETEKVEFKQAAFLSPHSNKPEDSMRKNVAEAVAAFMNSKGGILLIGVTDDCHVEGVDHEFAAANPSKKNWDGYQLAIADIIQNRLSISNPFRFYQVSQHQVYGKTICRIEVQKALEPVYMEKKLLVRDGNRTRELHGPDLINYVNNHWK